MVTDKIQKQTEVAGPIRKVKDSYEHGHVIQKKNQRTVQFSPMIPNNT